MTAAAEADMRRLALLLCLAGCASPSTGPSQKPRPVTEVTVDSSKYGPAYIVRDSTAFYCTLQGGGLELYFGYPEANAGGTITLQALSHSGQIVMGNYLVFNQAFPDSAAAVTFGRYFYGYTGQIVLDSLSSDSILTAALDFLAGQSGDTTLIHVHGRYRGKRLRPELC